MSKPYSEKEIEESLINFAKSHKEINSIYQGIHPEGRYRTYYFIAKKWADARLEDLITDIDIELNERSSYFFDLFCTPLDTKRKDIMPFLGEKIWSRSDN